VKVPGGTIHDRILNFGYKLYYMEKYKIKCARLTLFFVGE